MKKFILIICAAYIVFCPNIVRARGDIDILENLVIDDKEVDKQFEAIEAARNLVNKSKAKPKIFNDKGDDIEKAEIEDIRDKAPFGLYWGDSIIGVKKQGVVLEEYKENKNPNSYFAKYLPKPIKEMDKVVVSFGDDDKLWRVSAVSKFFEDEPNGGEVLKHYKRFGDLLAQKYPDNKEFFTPKKVKRELTRQEEQRLERMGDASGVKEFDESAIGDENFLKDIYEGEVSLYRAFRTDDVEVIISIDSDEDNKSYFTLLYKSKKIIKHRESKMIDAL